MNKFSAKQVFILIAFIVIGISFLETSAPMWTYFFWREFLLKVLVYGAASEFMVIFANVLFPKLFEN